MTQDDRARDWMWSEACEMLVRAERLYREFFKLVGSPGATSTTRYRTE